VGSAGILTETFPAVPYGLCPLFSFPAPTSLKSPPGNLVTVLYTSGALLASE